MLGLYKKTPFENLIEQRFKSAGILNPCDLTIEDISERFELSVWIMPGPSRALWEEGKTAIFIDSRTPEELHKGIFFHELCHPLFHVGDQQELPSTFTQLQEWQAKSFILYGSMPFYMIEKMVMPQYEKEFVGMLVEMFKVPVELAQKRVGQIRRRIIQARLDEELWRYLREEDKQWV